MANIPQGKAKWIYVILGLAVLTSTLEIANNFGFSRWLESKVPVSEIYDRAYENERVKLDGYGYNHCTFTNVTFVYNGGRTDLVDNNLFGKTNFDSDDPKVQAYVLLLNKLGLLRVPVFDKNDKLKFIPPMVPRTTPNP